MREILFRGLRADGKGWVEGSYTHVHDEKQNKTIIQIDTNNFLPIIPETVGQFTGLLDKNRKKIFEGDKLFIDYNRLGTIIVSFDKGKFNAAAYNLSGCEIIGTIHDHLLTNKP